MQVATRSSTMHLPSSTLADWEQVAMGMKRRVLRQAIEGDNTLAVGVVDVTNAHLHVPC